jgi:hypothetical protein
MECTLKRYRFSWKAAFSALSAIWPILEHLHSEMAGEPPFAHAHSVSDSTSHEQLLSPRGKRFLIQEHFMMESWLFRKVGFRSHFRQSSRISTLLFWNITLQLQVFPEALGIVVCILAFTPYLAVLYSTIQNNWKQAAVKSKCRINLSGYSQMFFETVPGKIFFKIPFHSTDSWFTTHNL